MSNNSMTAILAGVTTGVIVILFEFLKIDNLIIKSVILFIAIYLVLNLSQWSKRKKKTENN